MPRRNWVLISACCFSLTMGGCADPIDVQSGEQHIPPPPTMNFIAAAANELPAAIKKRGYLDFATNAPSTPMVFFADDNSTLIGYDIDLGRVLGQALGVDVRWHNISFDSVIPGLQAHRYDVGMSAFSITADRVKTVSFVSYYLSGGGFIIRSGSGISVRSFDDLCGRRVAVKKGVSQVASLSQADVRCGERDQPPVTIMQVPDENLVTLAVRSGRADIAVSDKPQATHAAARSDGALCITTTYQTSHSLTGMAVPRDNDELAHALNTAMNAVVESGIYAKINKNWGVGIAASRALPEDFIRQASSWGISKDGTIARSAIFTTSNPVPSTTSYFYQAERGCA